MGPLERAKRVIKSLLNQDDHIGIFGYNEIMIEWVIFMCYCDVRLGSTTTFLHTNLDWIATFLYVNRDLLPRSQINIGSDCHILVL